MVVGGVVQSVTGANIVISTQGPSGSSGTFFATSNVKFPASVTVVITNQTLIDSPHGLADLSSGTPIIAGGQLASQSVLDASIVTPITSSTISQGQARRASSVRGLVSSGSSGSLAQAVVSRATTTSQSGRIASSNRHPLDTTDETPPMTFSQQAGLPGINATYPVTIPLGKCSTVGVSVTVVVSLGESESWPIAVQASESAAIAQGSTGSVTLDALSLTPASANYQFGIGEVIDLSTSFHNSCLSININGPSEQFGEGIVISATVPAVFASPVVLCSPTSKSTAGDTCAAYQNSIVECVELTIPGAPGVFGISVCPRLTFEFGALAFNSFSVTGASLVTSPSSLTPTALAAVQPTNPTSYQLQAVNPQYSYTLVGGDDVQFTALGKVLLDLTVPFQPVVEKPLPNTIDLTLSLDAAPSPSPSPPSCPAGSTMIFYAIGQQCSFVQGGTTAGDTMAYFTSENPSVASVSPASAVEDTESVTVTATGFGNTAILVTRNNGGPSYTISVQVKH
jgi:hypothetical protein